MYVSLLCTFVSRQYRHINTRGDLPQVFDESTRIHFKKKSRDGSLRVIITGN